ncbi:DUF2407 C-terminal domain-containing protein [Globomyces pollinis-pini]|nr:DUF2407 C-terminal domain-containing protein [Globomyces pollinis-pini]
MLFVFFRKVKKFEMKAIFVRFVDFRQDVELDVDSNETILDVKNSLIHQFPEFRSKLLRIIMGGKLLADSTGTRTLLNEEENAVVHCCVSDYASKNPENNSTPNLQGFDRLLEMGIGESEVTELREQFHAVRGLNALESPNMAREAEEQWIDSTEPGNLDNQIEGSEFDLVTGLCIGFFLGLIVFIWIKESYLFSKKQQQGIIIGFLLNITFGIIHCI